MLIPMRGNKDRVVNTTRSVNTKTQLKVDARIESHRKRRSRRRKMVLIDEEMATTYIYGIQ